MWKSYIRKIRDLNDSFEKLHPSRSLEKLCQTVEDKDRPINNLVNNGEVFFYAKH